NQGLAATIRTGLTAALQHCEGQPDAVIVTMDADDTHPPEIIETMLKRMRDGADMVIASRYAEGGEVFGLSQLRKVLSGVASIVFRMLAPMPGVRDYTCGYRAYRAGMLQQVWARSSQDLDADSGFACQVQLLLNCSRLRPRIEEVPLTLRYDRKAGASKMRILRTIRLTLKVLIRHLLG
ncbi:MAG TPA: glycosyltransferase, partial [Candidatus Xenobia bacterium]